MATNASYAGNALQTTTILTQDISHETAPDFAAQIYALAHQNASAIPFVSYPQRPLSIKGQIVDSTIPNVDADVDAFKAIFNTNGQPFLVDYNGGSLNRKYIAQPNKISIDRPIGLLHADFEVDFLCTIPFGMDTTTTSLINTTGLTVASDTWTPTFAGTAPYQWPVITITYTAIGGSPAASTVTFGNNSNGQQISVNRTWTTGDVLVIDVSQLALNGNPVTVNGLPVAFTGAFPEMPPGASSLAYSDGFSSRTFNITVVYTKMYM